MLRAIVIAAALIAGSTVGLGAAPASAAQPCWTALINDWYDGHISGTYPLSCYRAALANMPEDLRIYSDLPTDLQRAMQTIIRRAPASSGTEGETYTTVQTPSSHTPSKPVPPGKGRQRPKGPIPHVLDLAASKPDSLPIPLLVLAGLGLILVASGAGGLTVRRLRARRDRHDDPLP